MSKNKIIGLLFTFTPCQHNIHNVSLLLQLYLKEDVNIPTKFAPRETQIHCKVTVHDKTKMDNLMHELGINTSDAIRLFIKQTILHQGIPFRITLNHSSSLDKAVHEIKNNDGHKSQNLNDLKKWINQ